MIYNKIILVKNCIDESLCFQSANKIFWNYINLFRKMQTNTFQIEELKTNHFNFNCIMCWG